MNRIGPTFTTELAAAGLDLSSLLAAWDDETGHVTYDPRMPDDQRATFDRVLAAHDPTKQLPPDNPTLSDWRVALTLWKRPDGTLRIDEVTKKVADLVSGGNPLGRIARERLEYANNVLRVQLLALKDALGFTAADVDESLWRADRVAKGDLSGVWPLPAST